MVKRKKRLVSGLVVGGFLLVLALSYRSGLRPDIPGPGRVETPLA